ncbi:MAG: hypothetical protein KGI26_03395 [Thaumarchaeota archaeon]|nr:hypothetical protein [Nitrososphaerota archaeon]
MANTSKTVGFVVLLVGLALLSYGGAAAYATSMASQPLVTGTQVAPAGDWHSDGVPLTAGAHVSGTLTPVNGTSAFFYFMTAAQNRNWGLCAPCTSPALINATGKTAYNLDYTVNATGTYFIVMDNSNGANNEAVQLSINQTAPGSALTTYEYVLAAGAVIAVIGVAMYLMRTKPKQ